MNQKFHKHRFISYVMHYRKLGKTGIEVSEIGFGAWGIGKGMWKTADDKQSMHALQAAIETGINFIDTALIYGDNLNYHSEKLVGQFLKTLHKDKKVYVATKIYPKNLSWPALKDVSIEDVFPSKWIYEAVDLSLKNLQVKSIDLMQFHVWQDEFVHVEEWKKAIQNITGQGKVKHWGISINDYEPSNCLRTLDSGLISTIQFIFNIYHQQPIEDLLPYAKKHNIGLIARVPLDEGGLSGNLTPTLQFTDWRRSYFRGERITQAYQKQEQLKQVMQGHATTIPELALRWILNHKEVSTVIPGMRTVEHVKENVQVSDYDPLPASVMNELKKHTWERDFYQ